MGLSDEKIALLGAGIDLLKDDRRTLLDHEKKMADDQAAARGGVPDYSKVNAISAQLSTIDELASDLAGIV